MRKITASGERVNQYIADDSYMSSFIIGFSICMWCGVYKATELEVSELYGIVKVNMIRGTQI